MTEIWKKNESIDTTGAAAFADSRLAMIDRIRSGDRHAAADFVTQNGALIRRRYRQRLGRAMRRLVDSQELLSTISRRFDAAVREQAVLALDEAQLFALVFKIGDYAMADKGRVMAGLERVESEDSQFAFEVRSRLARADRFNKGSMELELDSILRYLRTSDDREILTHWLMGHTHVEIARDLGINVEAVRKNWERIKARVRQRILESGNEMEQVHFGTA